MKLPTAKRSKRREPVVADNPIVGAGTLADAGADALAGAALEAAGIAVCHALPSGTLTFDNTAQTLFGVPAEAGFLQMIARVPRVHRRDLFALIRGVRWSAQPRSAEFRFAGPDGGLFWIKAGARRMKEHCAHDCAVVTLLDVSADREMKEALLQSEQHLRYTVEYNPQLPWIADPSGHIIEVTDRWLAASGMSRESALGVGFFAVLHPDDIPVVQEKIAHALTTGEPFDVRMRLCVNQNYRWMRAQGYPRRDEQGNIVRWYGYTEDIHEHVLVEDNIRWNAEHDLLTGLWNRALFNSRLEKSLKTALQSLRRVGVLLIDIDHFKEVNDLLGHHAGDALLQSYAELLRTTLPADAVIARLGGDEFAVLFPQLKDPQELLHWGEQILRFDGSVMLECRASIGAAMFPEHGAQGSELLRHADIALYAAKDSGRGQLAMFELAMQEEVRERAAMVNRARTAAKSGDILAFYQPKVSLDTGALVGFEALLRWRDALGQIHTPASIIAAFEEHEVADLLGRTMLDHVVADIVNWRHMGLDFGSVAINAAPAELRQSNFAPRLIRSMEEARLRPADIEVEITEGVFLGRGSHHAKRMIAMLSEHGNRIVLDDFGTGFASLSHLRALPVSVLKIDQSFITDITDVNGDAAIVSAIINLARDLDIKVVAEGLETIEQVNILKSFKCEQAQGYYFGRPTPASQIPALIRNWLGGASLPSIDQPSAILSDRPVVTPKFSPAAGA